MQGVHGGDIYRNKVTLDFSVNINPFGMPKEVETALHNAVGQSELYPDIVSEELKQSVSQWLSIDEDKLAFGNGASELFMAIVRAINPRRAVIPVPSFLGYQYALEAVENETVYVELKEENGFIPDDSLIDALTEQTDLLFLTNPNNPTGILLNRQYLHSVLQHCKDKNILVVLDECFIEFCGEEHSFLSETANYSNLLVVRAFTKSFAIPGVRLGYLVGSDALLLDKIKKQLPEWNLSVFAQQAGVACVKAKDYLDKTVKYIDSERKVMKEQLEALGLRVYDGRANFLLFYSEIPLYEKLLERGILIRDCSNYKGLSKGYYRVAVKKREENETLWKAIGECIG
ncbi:MAG: aminotransferase class I/II-fold pyridoxal phosphate-dependent enzyme [Lachnospiraceae bacterium]|nr:aminotransferase class I/II-fold pyridoxal phosphate-dependent enzyme [Lachnospiraceae bacterium]